MKGSSHFSDSKSSEPNLPEDELTRHPSLQASQALSHHISSRYFTFLSHLLIVRVPFNFSVSSCVSVAISAEKGSRLWFSTAGPIDEGVEEDFVEEERPELQPHGVDPRKGWGFRGVHRVKQKI